jgi:uncharacterized protein (DUF1330 family)
MFHTDEERYIDHSPITEEESMGLLNKGKYVAYVKDAGVKSSKSGKKYLVFDLDVYDNNGKTHRIIDWMALEFKVKHFYESTDMEEKYKQKRLFADDCLNKEVVVEIGLSKVTNEYPRPKNMVIDYFKKSTDLEKFYDDKNIPF